MVVSICTETVIGESPFFLLLNGTVIPAKKSLQTLTGEIVDVAPTPMIQRVKAAWMMSLSDLSCEQVRLLVSQKMGLDYLAEPVAKFVRDRPDAWVTFYRGDLSVSALRAFPELLAVAPAAAREMAFADFGPIVHELKECDPELARKVEQCVEEALALARGHS